MTYYKTLPNAREREMAAKFFFEDMPAPLVTWIKTGLELREFKVDEDVVELAHTLAGYRMTLERQMKQENYNRRNNSGY